MTHLSTSCRYLLALLLTGCAHPGLPPGWVHDGARPGVIAASAPCHCELPRCPPDYHEESLMTH